MDDTLLLVLVRRLSAAGHPDGQAGLAALHLDDDTLVITPDAGPAVGMRPLALSVGELAGLVVGTHPEAPDSLLLHPRVGVPIGIQPRQDAQRGDLLAVGLRAERRAFTLPELTRGLRAVGARRGAPGNEHDLWFGALLSARQEAARADSWDKQAAAFTPHSLRRQLVDSLAALAIARYPGSPADQRALVAALEELASPLGRALEAMDAAAERLRSAGDFERLIAWRAWVEAIRSSFAAADRSWLAMTPVLARHAPVEATWSSADVSSRRRNSWWRSRGANGRAS